MTSSCGYITSFSKWVVLFFIMLQLLLLLEHTVAEFSLKADSGGEQALKPGVYSPNTVPAFPVQTQTQTCRLDLSDELFGGVDEACGHNLDRSRCCPVLAAWLFSAHARTALQVPAPSPASSSSPSSSSDLPMMPDDSQKCVNSLQSSLQSRDIQLPQPNASCDAILCFCGIRLHQITSLRCPAAFNVSSPRSAAAPTTALKRLEHDCRNSSYAGCTRCLESLEKLKGDDDDNRTDGGNERTRKMFGRDCQLMGLTWLLARNKTAYIPTVSAVLRAVMYTTSPPHQSKCSPDQENMPLAVDSLQFHRLTANPAPPSLLPFYFSLLPATLSIIILPFLLHLLFLEHVL